jgi:two-component system, OmpR family, sensor histidine kinase KdpD
MKDKRTGRILKGVLHVILMLAFLGAATAVGYIFRYLGFHEANYVIVYLLAVLLTAWKTSGYLYGILASIVATFSFNFFFTVPYFTFAVHDPGYLVTFAVMTITAIITSTLTSLAKRNSQEAREKEAETKAVYNLTYRLSDAKNMKEITDIILKAISEYLYCSAELLDIGGKDMPEYHLLKPVQTGPQISSGDFPERKNSFVRLQDGIYADEAYWPIIGRESLLGIVRIPRENALLMGEAQNRLMRSMMETTAMAMERLQSAELNIKTRELAEQERYRGNLLRAISHDLRTPLSGIIGTSEILMAMTNQDDPRYSLSKDIYTSADWLHAMVENILSLTRLQDGKLMLDKQSEAAEEVVGGAVNQVLAHAPGYDITVKAPNELLLVPMDAKLIKQVLINLLDNAIKHTASDGEITASVDADTHFAYFTIRDSGSGIDENDLPHIFEMFYTTKSKLTDAKLGIGLGLAICDAIVKAHGGSITARNRPDCSGAEFIFTLPLEEKEAANE